MRKRIKKSQHVDPKWMENLLSVTLTKLCKMFKLLC